MAKPSQHKNELNLMARKPKRFDLCETPLVGERQNFIAIMDRPRFKKQVPPRKHYSSFRDASNHISESCRYHRSSQGRARALQDAASVALLLITTEAMIAENPKNSPAGGGMGGGGMGGMEFQEVP